MSGSIPDPAVVVLIGASGSGKSTWAAERYRAQEMVSSDDLRGIVGSGRNDLDASADAFHLLDSIVQARARRGLTCVVDTLGLDADRRHAYLALARAHGLAAVAVVFVVAPRLARERNARRDHPVPSSVHANQLSRSRGVLAEVHDEGWDVVEIVRADSPPQAGQPIVQHEPRSPAGLDVVLQISRFPWGDDPSGWLRGIAEAASSAGFAGLALMDHLIQIPQVGRAWEPIPEPWVTLGMLAGLDTNLRLGTLVSPVTFRPAGITAKTVATLDALSGGRAFLGIGAGWWEREHAAYDLPFPDARTRLDALETAIETIRALWSPGTKAYTGERVQLAETTCYPRPASDVPIIVGGSGSRTLRIAARLGDGCNVSCDDGTLPRAIEAVRGHCAEYGRDQSAFAVTVLDIPVVGHDRDEVWARVERFRGRSAATSYARQHHAGTMAEQRERYGRLADVGVDTIFVAPLHISTPDDVAELAPMLTP